MANGGSPNRFMRRTIVLVASLVMVLVAVALMLRGSADTDPPAAGDMISKSAESKDIAAESASSAPSFALPVTPAVAKRLEEMAANVSASSKDWPTEAFSEAANANFKKLAKHISSDARSEGGQTGSVVFIASAKVVDTLRPQKTKQVKTWPQLEVRRYKRVEKNTNPSFQSFESGLGDLFKHQSQRHAAFKIIRVEEVSGGFDTTVYAEGNGLSDSARLQWTAHWQCTWSATGDLEIVDVLDYEEVVYRNSTQRWLEDVANVVLGQNDSYGKQLLYGMDYWVNRLEHCHYANRLGHHGLAIGDVNGDGLEDLYVCQPGALPNRLYIHQPDGSATDGSAAAGIDFLDDTTAALFADFDNDGDQDLAVLTINGGFVLSNDGSGVFKIRATMPDCRNAFSLTAADYDNDGLVDLYIGRYWPSEDERGAIPLPVPYYDALNGGANKLLRNVGELNFEDVTKEAGLDVDNSRYTMAAAWEDFDQDGDQDLYVANDFGRNCLYRNDDGRFTNVADSAKVEDTAAGMSVSWGDFDRDGKTDLYVGNMFSSAGGRITYQRQYAENFDATAQAKLQRLARGNSLFQNRGDEFDDVSVESASTMGRWAWGSLFADLNNDGFQDLVVANGHVTTEDTGDL